MALRLITDHVKECADARRETRNAIKDVSRLLITFMGAVFIVVVAFAGYSYVQSQSLATQLNQNRIAQAQAVAAIPQATADKVAAKLPDTKSSNGN